jgi:hypothetical protein
VDWLAAQYEHSAPADREVTSHGEAGLPASGYVVVGERRVERRAGRQDQIASDDSGAAVDEADAHNHHITSVRTGEHAGLAQRAVAYASVMVMDSGRACRPCS